MSQTPAPKETVSRCTQAACTVAKDGKCYEGLQDPSTCVNYSEVSAELVPSVDEEVSSNDKGKTESAPARYLPPAVSLYRGIELDYKSSLRITRANLTRVIVLAGPNDSGKTTVLASIFDHFLRGSFGGYLFAGSETLPAFERRCHLARTDSELETEDTERTKSDSEQSMLHLSVCKAGSVFKKQHLLLSDIRGELFRAAAKSKAEAQKIKMLKRGDHVCIILDGKKIIDLRKRNATAIEATTMIRSFLEAEMIGPSTILDVVFTKDDLIQACDATLETPKFIQTLEDQIKEKHLSQLHDIRFHRIAARPDPSFEIESYGLSELFQSWVQDSAIAAPQMSESSPFVVRSERQFDRFAAIQIPKKFSTGEPL